MYNLAISFGIAAALFVLTGLIGGSWVAGILPALLGFVIAYFLLGRRVYRQLQAVMEEAQAIGASAQMVTTPQQQQEVLGRLKAALEKGFPLEKWQFGVASQIHAQLGSLEYMQRNFDKARAHLVHLEGNRIPMLRNWPGLTMLALMDFRKGEKDKAIARLATATSAGAKDPLFWGVYAYVAKKSGKDELAVKLANEGVEKNPSSDALKQLADQLRNKKPLNIDAFGQGWVQFFPEEAQRLMGAQMAQQQQAMAPQNQNRAARRAAERGKPASQANTPKGINFPHPKR